MKNRPKPNVSRPETAPGPTVTHLDFDHRPMDLDLDDLERAAKSGALDSRSLGSCHPGGEPLIVIGVHLDIFLELIRLARDAEELQWLFDSQHKRTQEADKLWQQAHNKPDILPDLGDLIQWLLEYKH